MERLVKDWTGVGGVSLASFLETYKQIKIKPQHLMQTEIYKRHTHTCKTYMYLYKGYDYVCQ